MEALEQQLTRLNQQHLLHFWSKLSTDQQQQLQQQLNKWNLPEVCANFLESTEEMQTKKLCAKDQQCLQPLPADRYVDRCELNEQQLNEYKHQGLDAIGAGQVAVIVLAGGQGTRLGFNKPKGLYDIGLPSGKSLFRIQMERLLRLQTLVNQKYHSGDASKSVLIHLFVMTSPNTHEDTSAYFEQQQYFGLKAEQVHFLQQEVLPCFGVKGDILLADQHEVAESPDGNGGLYSSLARSGALQQMNTLGIKYVHVYCVDNALVRIADPAFVGFVVAKQLSAAAKAVNKRSPDEPVGVFGLVNNNLKVLEYSEISKEQSELKDTDGKLTYRFGNICNHLFTVEFLEKVASAHLPHHVALKKITHVDLTSGQIVKPDKVNGIKLEKFIFDVFELTSDFGIWVVSREEEFSPVKNSPQASEDSPVTARNAVYKLNANFVRKAGGNFVSREDQTPICEISPLVSYDGENLEQIVSKKQFDSPLVLYDSSENRQNVITIVN